MSVPLAKYNSILCILCCCLWLVNTKLIWNAKPSIIWRECPNQICLCRQNNTDTLMRCYNRSLTVIPPPPPPPPDLGHDYRLDLTLDHNNLSRLTPDIFSNMYNVSLASIIFYKNIISDIAIDTFSHLHKLEQVVFSDNNVSVSVLAKAMVSLKDVPLMRLTISNTELEYFPSGFFSPLANLGDLSLSLVNNRIKTYDGKLFENFNGLIYLNLRNNQISQMNMSKDYVQNVTRLRLDYNRLETFPALCNDGWSHFPQLDTLEIRFNHISVLENEKYNCLNKLREFRLNGNLIQELKKYQFANLKSLRTLQLSYIGTWLRKVHPEALHSSSLRQLYFRKNYIQFTRYFNKSISLAVFGGCPSLELLDINFNVLSYLKESDYDEVFRNLTRLTSLIMGGGGLKFIPKAITKHLKNLKYLALYHNEIKDVPQYLHHLKNLTHLYLAHNEITSVSEHSFPSKIVNSNTTALIDLSANPLSCGCESFWLIKGIQFHPKKFNVRQYSDSYVCHSPLNLAGTLLQKVQMSEQMCLLSWNNLMIVLVGSSVLITILVVTSLLYYFRWNLMYMLYMMRYRQREVVDKSTYTYDVFVAYSVEDLGWVKEKIMSVLEGKDKLKLCIHNRNFEVGKLIVDNIVDSVERSRKIIIVLSNNFAKSSWCQFELDLILRHMIERGQRLLVVVLLEEINQRYITKSMRVMLQTTTYLEWGEESHVQQAFYNRLRLLVKIPVAVASSWRRKLSV